MRRSRIGLLDSDFGDCEIEQQIIEAAGFEFVDLRDHNEPHREATARSCHGLLVQYEHVGEELLGARSQVEVVVPYGVGTDMIDAGSARSAGVRVLPVLDYCTDEVADHALALALACLRRIVALNEQVQSGSWPPTTEIGQPRALAGRRFAVVGFGNIGRAVLRRAASFGAIPVAHDPFVDNAAIRATGAEPVSIEDAFRCDVVSLHLPLTADTREIVSDRLLGLLPVGAVLVNVARGGIIDERALQAAVESGRITAGLDVLSSEPPAPGNVLVNTEGVIITPHTAWYSSAAITRLRRRVAETVVDHLHSTHSDRQTGRDLETKGMQ